MKNILTVSALLLLISGNALAGSEYDRCIKEEKYLKAQKTSQCSGFRYILNPSACFATRKALKEYKAGKCRQIGIAENVNFSTPTTIPEKKRIIPASVSKTESNGNTGNVTSVNRVESVIEKKTETEVQQHESTIEQLKEENARLKSEISRLKSENEQLRKTGQ
jgi:hypothetical protein